MSDYQAIYDAVRSRISGGNIGDTVREVLWQQFDISHVTRMLQQEYEITAYEMRRPSVLFKPLLSRDGDMWCALLGENLHEGLCAFGETPEKALINFDVAFLNEKAKPQVAAVFTADDHPCN